MISADLDLCIITETWIKDEDCAWIDSTELNQDGYKVEFINRKHRSGGGIAIVYRGTLSCQRIPRQGSGKITTFEHGSWKVHRKNQVVKLELFYHPPTSKAKKSSIMKFIDEFLVFAEANDLTQGNVILAGDFNIHVNDLHNQEALDFGATMEALGMYQHVKSAMH